MFYDKKADLLDSNLSKFKEFLIDLQPYSKNVRFDDGIELQISHRAFCPLEKLLDLKGYLRVDGLDYKILEIHRWDDYLEVYLYQLEV